LPGRAAFPVTIPDFGRFLRPTVAFSRRQLRKQALAFPGKFPVLAAVGGLQPGSLAAPPLNVTKYYSAAGLN